ncbi:MAG: site-2 protease family protein [Phycisphaerales bacterium]
MGQQEWKSSYDDDADRFAGIKKVLARIFGDGENPIAWGFPVATVKGISIRVHLIMVVYLLSQLIFTMPGHKAGAMFVIPSLIAVIVLVTLREAAGVYVALRNGATCDRIMLWPLGALENPRFEESFEDETTTKIELRTALAPTAFHLACIPVFLIPLVLITGSTHAAFFNPFSPSSSIYALTLQDGITTPWWLVTIWSFHVVNLIILTLNLIPMSPLDGGNILRIILERNKNSLEAHHAAAYTGLWVATAVGLLGLLFSDAVMLLAIAIVAGIVCTIERRRVQFLGTASMIPGFPDPSMTSDTDDPKQAAVIKNKTKYEPDPEHLDAILQKISDSGIDSLTRSERRTLKKATESSRNTE